MWLNLQKRYDLQRAEQELGEKINAIPTLDVAWKPASGTFDAAFPRPNGQVGTVFRKFG